MENEELILKNAYKNLSDDIKQIISSSEWLKRVKEIGQKYSLTEKQIDSLGYEVLFTFLNLQSSDFLSEAIEEELDISSILAEQIMEEIEERVFAWGMKKLEQKHTVKENALDIPPPNLPGEEIVDAPETIFAKEKHSTVSEQAKEFFAPQNTPAQNPKKTFSSTTIPPIPQKPSFIAHKLTQPTRPQQTTPVEIPKTYTVDPYREPLE